MKATANELPDSDSGQLEQELVQSSTVLKSDKSAVLLLVVMAVVLVLPIAAWGIPEGGDLANHYRFALPFYESIQKGNLYPGWLAESNGGYGDARFRFYPPAFYFLLAALKPLAGWFGASVISFALLSALGSLGVYLWTRAFLAPQFAALASVFYAIAPYHLNELYQASLLSEYAGCAVLPFVFAFIDRVCERKRLLDVVGLGAAVALLILTNLPLAVIGSLSALVFSLVRAAGKGSVKIDLRLAAGVLLGLAASACFWVRMLSELPWIKGSRVNPRAYYDYRLNFVFSSDALTNRNTWYANLLAVATIGFLLPMIVPIWKDSRIGSRRYAAITVVTLFSFFMSLPLSKPLWELIPKLPEVQFPWRWLAIVSLMGSVLLATAIPHWLELLKTRIRPLYFLPAIAFGLSLIFIASQIIWDSDYMSRKEFNSFLPTIRGAVSFKDWLPVDAREQIELPKMTENVEVSSRQVAVETWEAEYRKFSIGDGPAADARVKTFYYPNWAATAAGSTLPLRPSDEGITLISVPAGATSVQMMFREPMKVRLANVVSGVTWILIFMMGVYAVTRRNKTPESLR